MTQSAPATTAADRLRGYADELLSLAEAVEQPSRSTVRADMLIAEGERIAEGVWAAFRGRG